MLIWSLSSSFLFILLFSFFCFWTDVPNAVRSVKAITKGCMALLVWNPPENTGCPIKGYFVYYREVQMNGSPAQWTRDHIKDAENSQYELPLQCGRRYEVYVTAINVLGESRFKTLKITTGLQGRGSQLNQSHLPCVKLLLLLLSFPLLKLLKSRIFTSGSQ